MMRELADGLSHHIVRDTSDVVGIVGGECRSCERRSFPATRRCRYCASREVEQIHLPPTGQVYASTVARVPLPGFSAPYAFGYVAIDDGPRVFGRICDVVGDATQLPPGTRVQLIERPIVVRDGRPPQNVLVFVERDSS